MLTVLDRLSYMPPFLQERSKNAVVESLVILSNSLCLNENDCLWVVINGVTVVRFPNTLFQAAAKLADSFIVFALWNDRRRQTKQPCSF